MPDFCKNSNVLILLLFVPFSALLIELLQGSDYLFELEIVAMTAIYILWVLLFSAVWLCFIEKQNWKFLGKQNSLFYWSVRILIALLAFSVVEVSVQYYLYDQFNKERFFSYLAAYFIVLIIFFRVFALLDIFKQRAQSETNSRMQALQARIEPHFLFNSLNTIAELTHLDPQQAEEAIQSLSSLIRNSLSDESVTHSLEDEIQLCQQYLQLEKWRLGDRLDVFWDIQIEAVEEIVVPKVLFQPLIENAVIHGVAPFEDGGKVAIKMSKNKRMLKVVVENKNHGSTLEPQQENRDGLGIALNNIKERLFVLYDDNHKLNVKRSRGLFTVSLELPDSYQSNS